MKPQNSFSSTENIHCEKCPLLFSCFSTHRTTFNIITSTSNNRKNTTMLTEWTVSDCESTRLNKYSFVDTKSPSLIHLHHHHPPYPHQRRQIKLSLDDDVITRLSPPPPPPRDIIDTDFNSNMSTFRSSIVENDSNNRTFIDRTSLIGEFPADSTR